jgi:ATP-dependent RNA helicase DDX3X
MFFPIWQCTLIATGILTDNDNIDFQNVFHIINYDLPFIDYGGIGEYTHRMGMS